MIGWILLSATSWKPLQKGFLSILVEDVEDDFDFLSYTFTEK